ncbi:hypothetical protein ABB05_01920 [Lederbergia galactosidilytica]|uniref:Uncharacterized protein n=1 Tax=Lederbergia galactosidilytica TaxID=217031 RepID=A0A178A5M1_9BACI|nr:hypothetical protein ABB05_01920 [Lederbergia galactosidilytica]
MELLPLHSAIVPAIPLLETVLPNLLKAAEWIKNGDKIAPDTEPISAPSTFYIPSPYFPPVKLIP